MTRCWCPATLSEWEAGNVVLAMVDDALHVKDLRAAGDGWKLAPENGKSAIPVGNEVRSSG